MEARRRIEAGKTARASSLRPSKNTNRKADPLSRIRFSYATGRGRTDVLRIFSPALEPTQLQWRWVCKVSPKLSVWQWSRCRKRPPYQRSRRTFHPPLASPGRRRFAFQPTRPRIFRICEKNQGSGLDSEHSRATSGDNIDNGLPFGSTAYSRSKGSLPRCLNTLPPPAQTSSSSP